MAIAKSETTESSDDYFCKEKTDNLPSKSLSTIDPLELMCFIEEAEEQKEIEMQQNTFMSDDEEQPT